MEKAIYISKIEQLKEVKNCTQLYFGVEFCEFLIPSPQQIEKALEFAREKKMGFSLVTPYVSDKGLNKLIRVFDRLVETEKVEVVVNDFGTLHLLRREYPSLIPVLGRLLTRQKRGFGISSATSGCSQALLRYFQSSNIDNPVVSNFLNSRGIYRVEFDNLLQGIEVDLSDLDISASLYVPYGYVTTTRYCPWSFDEKKWENLSGSCSARCRDNFFLMRSGIISGEIFMRGNTVFFRNDRLPSEDWLESRGINRLVFEIDIPM